MNNSHLTSNDDFYPRIVHFGHWCVDMFMRINGELEKDTIISPLRSAIRIGGSATFAIASGQLGCSVTSVLLLSNDVFSDLCRKTLDRYNVKLISSVFSTGSSSPVCVVLESDIGWRTAIVVPGVNHEVAEHNLHLDAEDLFKDVDIVHHGYPFLTPSLGWSSVGLLAKRAPNALHVVDLNGAKPLSLDYNSLALDEITLLIKGNEAEWRLMSGSSTALDACRAAVDAGVVCAVATMGEEGASAISIPNSDWLERFETIKPAASLRSIAPPIVVNTTRRISGMVTGAGDAFMTGLLLSLSRGIRDDSVDLESSLRTANEVAAIWIERGGKLY